MHSPYLNDTITESDWTRYDDGESDLMTTYLIEVIVALIVSQALCWKFVKAITIDLLDSLAFNY